MTTLVDRVAPAAVLSQLPRQREGEPRLLVLVGASGSGKSTWARERFVPGQILSLDALRAVVSGDECDQAATPAAVDLLLMQLEQRLTAGLTTVVDATSVRAEDRARLLAIAAAHRLPADAAVFTTSLETCLSRNATRPGPVRGRRYGRRVPAQVVFEQHTSVAASVPLLAGEGFRLIQPIVTEPADQPQRAGTIYLLHFDRAYRHAGHYTGWTLDLPARLAEHRAGHGARLISVVQAAGISWSLARTWPGPRSRERRLKQQGGAARRCPLCGIHVRPARQPA